MRSTAEILLKTLVQRTQEVNDNPIFVYSIKRVAVFGSYVSSDKKKLGDVDIAIELVPRYKNEDLRRAMAEAFNLRGPQTCSITERWYFARYEIERYLRNKSKCLSLHDYDELGKLNAEHVVIYEQPVSTIISTKNDTQIGESTIHDL
ncbi:MAG: nucleotidyltransferase domain-containing protein [Armatimonadota bacterium]